MPNLLRHVCGLLGTGSPQLTDMGEPPWLEPIPTPSVTQSLAAGSSTGQALLGVITATGS